MCEVKSDVLFHEYIRHGVLSVFPLFSLDDVDVVASDSDYTNQGSGVIQRIHVYTHFDECVRGLLKERPPKYVWQSKQTLNGGKIVFANIKDKKIIRETIPISVEESIEGLDLRGNRYLGRSQRHSERVGWGYNITLLCESGITASNYFLTKVSRN